MPMKLTLAHSIRPISTEFRLSGVAAIAAAILVSIAIVGENLLVLVALTSVAFALLFPVEVSLGVFAVLVPFDQVLVLGNTGVTLTWVAGAFAGATLVLYGIVSGRLESPPRAGLYWLFFVLWAAASTLWAIDPLTSLQKLPTVATLFAVYLVASSFRITRRELSRVALLALAGGAVAASLVIVQFAHHITQEGRGTLAVGNLESNANELAFSLLLPFSLALSRVSSERNRLKRVAVLAALVLVATAIFLSMSRGSLVALSVIVLVYLFRVGVRRRTVIGILLLAIPLLFLPDHFYHRLNEAATDRGTGRYDIWLAGLEIIKHSPIIGVGLANFPVAYQKFAGYAHVFFHGYGRGYTRAAHNMYLSVFAEMGVIGFALLMTAILSQMRAVSRVLAIRRPRDYFGIALEAACWGQLAAGLSGHIEWSKPFWLSLMLLAVVTKTTRELEGDGFPYAWDPSNQCTSSFQHAERRL